MAVAVVDPKIFKQVNDALDSLRQVLEVQESTKVPFWSFLRWYLPVAEKARQGVLSVREAAIFLRNGGVVAIRQMLKAVQLLQAKLRQRQDQAFDTRNTKQILEQKQNLQLVRNLENDVLGCSTGPMNSLQAGLLALIQTINRTSGVRDVTSGMRELESELQTECLEIRTERLRQ